MIPKLRAWHEESNIMLTVNSIDLIGINQRPMLLSS